MLLQAVAPVATWFEQIENDNRLVHSSSGHLQDPGAVLQLQLQQRIAELEMGVADRCKHAQLLVFLPNFGSIAISCYRSFAFANILCTHCTICSGNITT